MINIEIWVYPPYLWNLLIRSYFTKFTFLNKMSYQNCSTINGEIGENSLKLYGWTYAYKVLLFMNSVENK